MAERKHEMHEQMIDAYYAHNARKLHKTVDRILMKFGGLSDMDTDDFYSLANEVFADILRRYDDSRSFEAFLYSCLSNKIMTEMTRRNREKRRADRMAVSLDAPVGEDGGCTIGDLVAGGSDPWEHVGAGQMLSHKMERYLERLSVRQREVLELLSYCYRAEEIQRELRMSRKEYADAVESIRSYENIRILL